jgi:hypothetical protein
MTSKKFAYCRPPVDGKMWCRHWNGSWAPPFLLGDLEGPKAKIPPTSKEESEILVENITR